MTWPVVTWRYGNAKNLPWLLSSCVSSKSYTRVYFARSSIIMTTRKKLKFKSGLWEAVNCGSHILNCIWHKMFYYLIRKNFQNDEEWRLFHCNSILGCRFIQDFNLCKLEDLWRHNVDTKWSKITKICNICANIKSTGLVCCKNYT